MSFNLGNAAWLGFCLATGRSYHALRLLMWGAQ